jgi:hypothetical protein
VATILTTLEISDNLADGEPTVKAVGEPIVNLATGTLVAEGYTSGIAAVTAAATGGEAVTVLGSTLIPGVGEVILVGLATAGTVYVLDKAATYVFDHPTQVAHDITSSPALVAGPVLLPAEAAALLFENRSGIIHDVTHPVSTIEHFAHDIEPWHR